MNRLVGNNPNCFSVESSISDYNIWCKKFMNFKEFMIMVTPGQAVEGGDPLFEIE